MISLDQVLLLEKKVESAVEKIQQLQAENDALRSKCLELTNALSSKSEQLSTFQTDQGQIENGIKKALDRLNSIENSILKNADQAAFNHLTNVNNQVKNINTIQQNTARPVTANFQQNTQINTSNNKPLLQKEQNVVENPFKDLNFDSMQNSEEPEPEDNFDESQESEDTGFDIF